MGSFGDSGCSNKLFVRHSLKTKRIASLNDILSEEQKSIISKTHFRWFLELHGNIKIGRNILSDLLIRWDDDRGGFSFRDKFVEFKEIDVSLSLGLGLVGEQIKLNENKLSESHCRKYFGDGKYELDLVYEFILKQHKKLPSIDVCRLYILVAISEVLFPNRSRTIFPILFEIVDRISDLGTFCWARIVYHYLLSSLCKACTAWNRGKGATTIYVDGCVYVFQVWFCDRFIPSNVCVHKYPRFLHWMNINVGDKFIKRAMETGVMLDDYGASRTENSETCVKASVNSNGEELNKEDKSTINMKLIKGINDALEEQDGVIEELEEELSRLQAELLEGNNKDQGGYSTPCNQHDFDNNFDCEGGVYSHETVMKERVRRKRYKSHVCRTPYTGYSPKLD
ncbi:uncharacterized protein LOC128194272 [Vigna angularis]|uniref:uncharacterized protein LOC128194272 n=1 Tax=Phaseolus angularis TaxID=3914 RepID=UPI0022B4239F|nr:uncharacterized protein LOC128194272 [Vigna angularis]